MWKGRRALKGLNGHNYKEVIMINRMAKSKKDTKLVMSGVVPSLSMKAGLGPPRTECAAGALMPWAEKLWAVTYVSSGGGSGVDTGLFKIDEDLNMVRRPESRVGGEVPGGRRPSKQANRQTRIL